MLGEEPNYPTSERHRPSTFATLPEIDLRHALRLTDDTGLLQHAKFALRHFEHGYCLDDNARALIAAVYEERLLGRGSSLNAQQYLTFVVNAYNEQAGRFRNFMSYERHWLEEFGSEDSQGRALWALGTAANVSRLDSIRLPARELFARALPAMRTFTYLRSRSFALLGLRAHVEAGGAGAEAEDAMLQMAESLFHTLRVNAGTTWPWWEDVVTYDNAKIPQALFMAGHALGRTDMVQAGLNSLEWLVEVQTAPAGHLSIIGNNGWMRRSGERAQFDQQPLEAHALVEACLAASTVSGSDAWAGVALRCFEWFLGENDVGVPLYDPETGGCRDGLEPNKANANEGAESTLAYVLSLLELHSHREGRQAAPDVGVKVEPLGLGVVGASGFADFALEVYGRLPNLAPVAVWNRSHAKAQRLARRHGLKATEQLGALLEDPRVQIVYVATVPSHHAHAVEAALEAGKHVLVEKPLAIDLADAERIAAKATRLQRRLGVNYMMRFGPLAEPVTRIVQSGLLGAFLRGYVVNCAGDDGLPPEHWFWDPAVSGGIFVEHGVHFFDLLRSWFGDGRTVSARHIVRPSEDRVDQALCDVAYETGGVANFYHSFTQPHHLDRQEIRLIFERGELRMLGWVARELRVLAVLDDERAEELHGLFPNAEIVTVRLAPGDQEGSRRLNREPVSVKVRLRWARVEDGQETYRLALRGLMTDFVASANHPDRLPAVGAADALASLELALRARSLASSSG